MQAAATVKTPSHGPVAVTRAPEVGSRRTDVVTGRRQIEEEIHKSLNEVRRTAIRAPVSGTVVDAHFETIGGVISPGDPILDIVPQHEELFVEVRASSKDIGEVHGISRRTSSFLASAAAYVADALLDEKTNKACYLAKLMIDRQHLREVAPASAWRRDCRRRWSS